MNCRNSHFLCFYNELKFYILPRDSKMLGLSTGIKISILSKSGHSTFVLSTTENHSLTHQYPPWPRLATNRWPRNLPIFLLHIALCLLSWHFCWVFPHIGSPYTTLCRSSKSVSMPCYRVASTILYYSQLSGTKPRIMTSTCSLKNTNWKKHILEL